MVKERKDPRRQPPKKVRSKEVNLLNPGTGIRFAPPAEQPSAKSAASPLRFIALVLLLAAAAAFYLVFPANETPPVAAVPAPAAPPLSAPPAVMQEEAVTADASAMVDAATPITAPEPVAAETPPPSPPPEARSAGPAPLPRWRIRFGIFVMRENAERYAAHLNQKGVGAEAVAGMHPMPSWTLKAGPLENGATRASVKSVAEKLNVAPMEEVDAKYLLIGPIWLKDRALAAEKKIRAIGVATTLEEARKDREVYKVLSGAYGSAEAVKRGLAELKLNGFEGVIDE